MGIATYSYNRTTSGGEIIRELVNSTDGQGLHFDGVAGNIDIATVPDVGTKNSFEFIVQANEWPTSGEQYIVDFGPWSAGRFIIANNAGDLKIKFNTAWSAAFAGFKLDDLKPHHLVVTANDLVATVYVDGNSIGTHTFSGASQIDSCTDAKIGSHNAGSGEFFNGTIYRARFWNRTLSEAEIKDSYENATVKFSNQYGSETDLNVMSCANGTTNPYTSFTSASATGFTAIQIGAVASSAGTADEIALVKGKDYRVTFYIANSSQAPKVSFAEDLNIGTPLQEIVGLGTLTTGTHTYDITYTGATTTGVLVFENTAAASYAIANLSITRIGVVADLDLAFSNMTQSDKVRDRSTNNVTGTASSGVTQVTPIEQLNTKSLSVGTTAATPADGQIIAGNGLRINAGTLQLDDIAESIDFIQAGAINFDSNDDQTGRFFKIGSGRAGGSGGGTTHLTIYEDTGVTEIAKVVETGGVLKSNLLTNSGLSVWSNGTLEDVSTVASDTMASDGTSGWTASNATLVFDTDHYEFDTSATNGSIEKTVSALTVGKLYKLSVDVKNGTASNEPLYFHWYFNGSHNGSSPTFNSTSGFVTNSWVFEATGAATAVYIKASNNTGGNVELKNFTLTEVTPGCVAADAKGPDGWYKDSTLDLYREHSGTNTKDGSFYAMRCAVTAANDYVAWPLTGIRQNADWLDRFAGRKVTFGAWFKTSTANHVYFDIYDGSSNQSDKHTGGGGWEWIEKTATISASPTYFFVQIIGAQSSGDFYISQPTLVFGSAIGEGNYSAPSGEWINLESNITMNNFSTTYYPTGTGVMNVEAESNGKLPKGCQTIRATTIQGDSASGSGVAFAAYGYQASPAWTGDIYKRFGSTVTGTTNGTLVYGNGTTRCDTNGDVGYNFGATGGATGTLQVWFIPTAVQLR
tara:strand:- start:1955 stop:4708 length:2754 start_codon:yes stop_codon:yes gene_type:complete